MDIGVAYDCYKDFVLGMARAMLPPGEADDVAAEVWLGLVEDPPGAVDNWQAFLVTVTARRVADYYRRRAYSEAGVTEAPKGERLAVSWEGLEGSEAELGLVSDLRGRRR